MCVDHRLVNYIDIDTKVQSSLTGGDTASHVGIFVPALGTVALFVPALGTVALLIFSPVVRGVLGNKCAGHHNLKTVKIREIMCK